MGRNLEMDATDNLHRLQLTESASRGREGRLEARMTATRPDLSK